MQAFLSNPALIAAVIGGLILLIIIAVAPAGLSNVVGELFQLVGRLITSLAGEAEVGADVLFGIVRDIFTFHKEAATKATRTAAAQKATGSSAQSGQSSGGQSAGGQPATTPAASTTSDGSSGQPAAAGGAPSGGAQQSSEQSSEQEDDAPFAWVAETIFVRLLYLATIIVIVAADFIFAILRLQAVLFPGLPLPKSGLFTQLSLLTGALLVSIVLLSGALTLDFFNVLPPPARLFPELEPWKRRLLLLISVLTFLLSVVVVGVLFLEGQLLTSLASTSPVGAVALATLLGVLQVLVVFLGAWGALRGLAIILALAGGVVGIVLHLVALVLRWVGEAFDVIGTSIIPEFIYAIAAIFGHRREQPPRASAAGNVLSIVGYGDRSSSFTALLCEDVVRIYARAGLLAAGAYADEPSVREDVRSRLAGIGVNNISPLSNSDPDPLATLKNHLVHAYSGRGSVNANKALLWIVDGEKVGQAASTLASLKTAMPDLLITVLCLLPPGGMAAEPFTQLKRLATQKLVKGETAICTSIVVDDRSPLYRRLGQPAAERMVSRSLAGMLLAPLHDPANPSFHTVVRNLDQAGYAFTALATMSGDGNAAAASSSGAARRPATSGKVSPEQTLALLQEVTRGLLTGANATTVAAAPAEDNEAALYLNFIVPISTRSPEFVKLRGLISTWLAEEYSIYLYSVVDGAGSVTSDTQVGVLYGITDAQLPQPAVARSAAAQEGQR